jgi:hypothetical protein
MIKVGDMVVWTQAQGKFKAKVIYMVKPGEKLHEILASFGFKPRSHTVNISKKYDRFLCLDDKGNWYSPLASNVYRVNKF